MSKENGTRSNTLSDELASLSGTRLTTKTVSSTLTRTVSSTFTRTRAVSSTLTRTVFTTLTGTVFSTLTLSSPHSLSPSASVNRTKTLKNMSRSQSQSKQWKDTLSESDTVIDGSPSWSSDYSLSKSRSNEQPFSATESYIPSVTLSFSHSHSRNQTLEGQRDTITKDVSNERSYTATSTKQSYTREQQYTEMDSQTILSKSKSFSLSKSLSRFTQTLMDNSVSRSISTTHEFDDDVDTFPEYGGGITLTASPSMSPAISLETTRSRNSPTYVNNDSFTTSPTRSTTRSPSVQVEMSENKITSTDTNTKSVTERDIRSPTLSTTIPIPFIEISVWGSIQWAGELLLDSKAQPRPYVELTLHNAMWRRDLTGEELVNKMLKSNSRTFENVRSTIAASSFITFIEPHRVIRLSIGGSIDFLADTDINLRFENIADALDNTNNNKLRLRWIDEEKNNILVLMAKGMPSASMTETTEATGAATAVMAAANPGSITTVQTFAMIGTMGCMPPSLRKMANTSSWALSPLYHWLGPVRTAPRYPSMVIWNVFMFMTFVTVHYVVVVGVCRYTGRDYVETAVNLMFPYIPLALTVAFLQGTYQAVFHTFTEDYGNGWIMIGIFFLSVPIGTVVGSYQWIQNHRKGKWVDYDAYVPSGWFGEWFYPRGVWLPLNEVVRFGVLYARYLDRFKFTESIHYLHMVVLALLTSFATESKIWCATQTGCTALVMLAYGFWMIVSQPHQCRLTSVLRGSVFVLQAMLLIVFAAASSQSEALNVFSVGVSMTVFLLVFTDTVISIWHTRWEGALRKNMVHQELSLDFLDSAQQPVKLRTIELDEEELKEIAATRDETVDVEDEEEDELHHPNNNPHHRKLRRPHHPSRREVSRKTPKWIKKAFEGNEGLLAL